MPMQTHIKTLLLIPFLTAVCLQGCSVSGGGKETPASNSGSVRLALSTSTGDTTLVADGVSSVPVQLEVTNGSGQGMSDVPVTFTTSAGSLSTSSATTRATPATAEATTRATGGSTTASATTGATGTAQATLTSGTNLGKATIRAQAMDFSTALTIDFISGIPAQVALRAIPSTVGVGTTTTIQATVTTTAGVPVEGATVTFALAVNNSSASLQSTNGTTNASGLASITYMAGSRIGTDTVRATVSGDLTSTVAIDVQATTVSATSLELLVSSPQLDSDGAEQVTLTALVRDANNNFVTGVPVTFAADSGGIQVTTGTTDASGKATAFLETAGDPTTRTITVTAVAGTLTSSNTVTVTGTTVTLSGASTLVLGQTTTLSILLRDSGGNGIPNEVVTLSSSRGNRLSAPAVTTDFNGQASVTVTATVAGTDTIQAMALGASGAFSLTVSSANFRFNIPTSGAEANLGTNHTITVHWDEAGVNQTGQTISFFATRGTLSAASAATGPDGNASVTISSTNAGSSAITATAAIVGGPSSQITIEFVATTPSSLILQANPTTLGVNAGDSTDQQSIITAIVRDATNNLVKNKTVSFSLFDVSGGGIFPPSAITDSFGRASTVYTAGATPSAQDGVIIDAQVAGTTGCVATDLIPTGPCDRVTLTVAQQALFITLGTGNEISESSTTDYALPYKAIVTDANSNPVPGVRVELSLFPRWYRKGMYVALTDSLTGAFVRWVPQVSAACLNEDSLTGIITKDKNGILDVGEDFNNNGVLDPGNVAAVPAFVTTDSNGVAHFDIDYPQDHANWVEVSLEARTAVAGSESAASTTFLLSVLEFDVTNEDVSPPGFFSPFGTAATCADPD